MKVESLVDLYNDPKVGLTGINDFKRKLNERSIKVSQNKITEFLETHDGYTKHKPVIKKFQTRRFYSPRIDEIWQADLAYFTEFPKENDNYIYWLVVLDTFSKFCWLKPLRSKTMEETSAAFASILETSRRKCGSLNTDNGTEFVGKTFQALLRKNNIHWYGTNNEGKAMMAERLIGTIKRKIGLYMTTHDTRRWIDALDDIVYNYNYNTIHSTTKFKPIDASRIEKQSAVYLNLYLRKLAFNAPKFKVGETVRIYKWNSEFTKSFKPNFTDEIFKVSEIVLTKNKHPTKPVTYKLADFSREPVTGSFYENEIVRYFKPDKEYEIESVISKKGNECLVKWKGYPTSMNSWIPTKQIKKTLIKF